MWGGIQDVSSAALLNIKDGNQQITLPNQPKRLSTSSSQVVRINHNLLTWIKIQINLTLYNMVK